MKKKKEQYRRVSIDFDERHLSTITTALEVYSRLRSGQIKVAMDAAFHDKELTHQDGEVLESFVRTIVFHKDKFILDNRNGFYGVGCDEMKDGTVAWEIKKAIEEYLHYERNDGYRDMGVDGDGVLNLSGIPDAKILDELFLSRKYWKPQKAFRIPQIYQEKISKVMQEKQYDMAWKIVDKSFKNKPLPRGKLARIEEVAGTYYVIVEKPMKL